MTTTHSGSFRRVGSHYEWVAVVPALVLEILIVILTLTLTCTVTVKSEKYETREK